MIQFNSHIKKILHMYLKYKHLHLRKFLVAIYFLVSTIIINKLIMSVYLYFFLYYTSQQHFKSNLEAAPPTHSRICYMLMSIYSWISLHYFFIFFLIYLFFFPIRILIIYFCFYIFNLFGLSIVDLGSWIAYANR